MELQIKPNGYWTKDRCQDESLKYKSIYEFNKKSCSAYNASYKNGWLKEICLHMAQSQKPTGHWNEYTNCKEEALIYKNRNNFRIGSKGAYISSLKNNWLDEFYPKKLVKK